MAITVVSCKNEGNVIQTIINKETKENNSEPKSNN